MTRYIIQVLIVIILMNTDIDCWKVKNIFKKKKGKTKQIRVLEDQAKKQFDRQIPNCEDYGLHGCDPTTADACSECYSRCGRQCEDFLWLSLEAVNFRMLPRAESQKECKLPSKKKSTRILCYTTAGRRHVDPTEQIIETMSISNPAELEDAPTHFETNEELSTANLPAVDSVPMTQKMLEETESRPEDPSAVMFRQSKPGGELVSSIELDANSGKFPFRTNYAKENESNNAKIYIVCGAILILSVFALFGIIIYKKRTKSQY